MIMEKSLKKIFLTGATGFVGRGVASRLLEIENYAVFLSVRSKIVEFPDKANILQVTDLTAGTVWADAVRGTSVVIHSAARVHMIDDLSINPLEEFRRVNVEGTLNLARQAAAAGVKRFIFISSIKVNGEGTLLGKPYTADDIPAPSDPYGISKMEAEQNLRVLAEETGMEVVILRPVLVYGAGVKANFRSMMNWLSREVPLPLGAIHNQRSLVALENLVDLIVKCIDHPAAANQIFLVSDGEDLSTTQLLQRMGQALDKPARLLAVPLSLLTIGAVLLGKKDVAQRLCGSLQVDISKTRSLLGWDPLVSVDAALRKTAQHFLAE